ncbi:hypothetical protein GCM10027565_37210 [Bordetella tumulicola]
MALADCANAERAAHKDPGTALNAAIFKRLRRFKIFLLGRGMRGLRHIDVDERVSRTFLYNEL